MANNSTRKLKVTIININKDLVPEHILMCYYNSMIKTNKIQQPN